MLLLRKNEMKVLRELVSVYDLEALIEKGYFILENNPHNVIKKLCKILGVSVIDTLVLCDKQRNTKC